MVDIVFINQEQCDGVPDKVCFVFFVDAVSWFDG